VDSIFSASSATERSSSAHYLSRVLISPCWVKRCCYQTEFLVFAVNDFAHTIGYAALVQGFVGVDLITVFVANSDQEKSTLAAVDCYLSNQLVETLLEELLTNWADSDIACLPLFQPLIKFDLQLNYFSACCRS
jgi:hypothetical protein